MKAFFYIPSLKTGGAEKQCALIASALKTDFKCDVSIILTHPADPNDANKQNWEMVTAAGIPVHVLCWRRVRDLYSMYRLFRKNRDAFLFCYLTFPGFWGGLIAVLAGLKNVYGGVRSAFLPCRFMIMEYVVHKFLARATIFNSYRGRENFIARHFDKDRSIVISNAIEPTEFIRCHDNNNGGIRIITVGTFNEAKDYHTLLSVIREVHARTTVKIHAVIIGYGALENMVRKWISDFNLSEVVEILPGNHGVGIPEELAKSDVYLNTSLWEGTSNSLMEAMRAGLPIVATDVGDNGYLVRDGKNGFICKPKDVDGIAAAVLRLIENQPMRKAFGEEAVRIISNDHSIDCISRQYIKLMEESACI